MIEREIEIRNKLGLHARAAAKLVHTAARFASEIKVKKGSEEVDGKSILGVLLLAAAKGSKVTVSVDGSDENEAIESIQRLFEDRFDESE